MMARLTSRPDARIWDFDGRFGDLKSAFKAVLSSRWVTDLGAVMAREPTLALVYHDLRNDDDNPSWLRVGHSDFRTHLEEIGRWGRFIAPGDLFSDDAATSRKVRVLLTFDDGYRNWHRLAWPLLEEAGIPALFFVSTHHLETGDPYWFDLMVTPVQECGLSSLDLREFGLRKYKFSRGASRPERWEDIQVMLRDVKQLGDESSPGVSQVIEFLRCQYGGRIFDKLDEYRPLSLSEITRMGEDGKCYWGSHSHRHEILTRQEDDILHKNLGQSKEILEKVLGRPVVSIAWPNGDSDHRVVNCAKNQGNRFAFGTRPGMIAKSCDRMRIPRIQIGGYDSPTMLRYKVNLAMGKLKVGLG